MALRPNGASINGIPGRLLGGFSHVDIAQVGTMHKRAVFAGGVDQKSAIPYGHNAPSAWQLPMKPGAMSRYVGRDLTVTTSGDAKMGVAASGSLVIEVTTNTPDGQLISSGSGTATFVISTNSPSLAATRNADGTATFVISCNTALLGAEASVEGTAPFTMTATLTPAALGHLVGSTIDTTAMTPDTVANAVWSKVIEAGYSADQIIRLLAAHAAGSATGLEGSNPQFTGLDGVTVRIDGNYAAGTRTIDSLNGD